MKSFFSYIDWKAGVITLLAAGIVGALLFWVVITERGGFIMSEPEARAFWLKNNAWMREFAKKIEAGEKYSYAEVRKLAKSHGISQIRLNEPDQKPYVVFVFRIVNIDNSMGVMYTTDFDPAKYKSGDPEYFLWSQWAKPLEKNWWLVKGS